MTAVRKLPWASYMTPEVLLPFSVCFVEKDPDECWVWRGALTSSGYGRLDLPRGDSGQRLRVRASRFMFAVTHGEVEANHHAVIRHTCDNRPCVNPRHLLGGTYADNARDAVERHRRTAPRGEGHGMARLTEAEVREIRRRGSESATALGREFGVTHAAIYNIVKRITWAALK